MLQHWSRCVREGKRHREPSNNVIRSSPQEGAHGLRREVVFLCLLACCFDLDVRGGLAAVRLVCVVLSNGIRVK